MREEVSNPQAAGLLEEGKAGSKSVGARGVK